MPASGGYVRLGSWWRCSRWRPVSGDTGTRYSTGSGPTWTASPPRETCIRRLYVARRTLADLGVASDGLLAIRDEQVVLDAAGPVPVDVLEFEASAAQALKTADEASLRAVADLYERRSAARPAGRDWLTARRDEVRDLHREVLVSLASSVRSRAPEEALVILTRVLESDPLHEGAVRASMMILADLGRRSEALARYERLVDDLLVAFGTDPDAQTAAVFRELLTGSPVRTPSRRVARPEGTLGDARIPSEAADELHRARA